MTIYDVQLPFWAIYTYFMLIVLIRHKSILTDLIIIVHSTNFKQI